MRRILLALSVCLLTTLTFAADKLPTPKNSLQPIDRVVAVVNSQVITQNELNKAYQQTIQKIQQTGHAMPDESTLKNEILNQLIYQNLQLQLVKRNNIKVTNAQVMLTIRNIAKQNNLTVTALKRKLLEQGVTYPKYRERIKRQVGISIIQRKVLGNKVKVSAAEVKVFLEKLKTQKKYATQYHIIDVLVALPAAPSTPQAKQARTEALKIAKSLRQGADILKITGATVNDLGWHSGTELPNLFTVQLKQMKVGGIAGPLRAGNGYHVIKLIDVRKSTSPLPSRRQVKNLLMNQKFQKAVRKWLIELRKKAYVKILVPQ